MVTINIFDVDSQNNEVPLLTLQAGEYILGRGSFSNCTDKRISRNHAVINIEDNKATLKSVHVNPCYYISHSEPKVQILSKDVPIDLNDGDKFAFLSDIWYMVKIETAEPDNRSINGISTLTIPVLNKDSSITVVPASSCTRVSNATSPIKRSLEELNSVGRKKLKTINESLDQLLENIKEIKTQDFTHKAAGESKKDDISNDDKRDVTTNEVFRKKDISESDDSDVDMVPEVTRDTEIVTNAELSKPEENEKVSSDSEDDKAESDGEPSTSNVEGTIRKEQTEASREETQTKNEPPQDTVKNEEPVSTIEGDDAASVASSVREDNKESFKKEQGDAAGASSSTSGNSIGNKLRREQCWYGESCYRKSASHREELSHPGDDDYDPGSNDERPECSYGERCYRSNQLHRSQYRHPTSRPAPKPSRKRKTAAAYRTSYTASDDEDDDDDEPFTGDDDSSSENYEEGDSDSDFSETPNFDDEDNGEEIKIMFKEAKKYLRNHPKD